LQVIYLSSDRTPNIDTLQDIEQLESWECNGAFNIHDGYGLQGEDGPDENHDGYLTDGDDLLDDSDIQENSHFNYSLVNLNDTGNEQGMQSDMTMKPPVDDESLLSADSNSLTVTNTAEPISDTGSSSTPPSNNTTTALNQAVQTFRFTRPPPSKQLSSDIPADGAGLKPPQLDIATEEFIVPETTFPQNFFILPQERTTGPKIDPKDQFNFFRMCVCGPNISAKYVWVPHLLDEQRPPVRKPYEFIDLFAPALLVNTRLILCSLRIPSTPWTHHPCHYLRSLLPIPVKLPSTSRKYLILSTLMPSSPPGENDPAPRATSQSARKYQRLAATTYTSASSLRTVSTILRE
jgi:hypothetical protein